MKKKSCLSAPTMAARFPDAEGLLRSLVGDRYEVSAPEQNPAQSTLCCQGDGRNRHGYLFASLENVDEFAGHPIDMVITVCDHAKRNLPDLSRGCAKDPSKF